MKFNKALETCPETWDDKQLAIQTGMKVPRVPVDVPEEKRARYWCSTVGMEKNGIRCIISPCLSTLISHQFDFVALDECHSAANLQSAHTQMLIRMQPKHRFAFSGTPLPNIVSNMFALMGWLTTPGWFRSGVRSAAWPYAREELGIFENTFLTKERDFTQESMNDKATKDRARSKVEKVSPVIASPARLLKLIHPTMAYISKQDCNPNYKPSKLVDIRVPLGAGQSKLYEHFLNRGNIPCKNPLIRARKQLAYLRNITADPAGFTHGGPRVSSNFNPKTMAVMELAAQIARQGDPLIIISSRIGQTDTYHKLLIEAGMEVSRIDSTTGAANQSYEANRFKRHDTNIMLMGIKCAAAWSFSECRYMIIGSIEYSPGPLEQAKGRFDRVNSKFDDRTCYCVLNSSTIEEQMFDSVAVKDDAVQIILKGQRVPRQFKPVDMGEVLADSMLKFESSDQSKLIDESVLEAKWPALCQSFR